MYPPFQLFSPFRDRATAAFATTHGGLDGHSPLACFVAFEDVPKAAWACDLLDLTAWGVDLRKARPLDSSPPLSPLHPAFQLNQTLVTFKHGRSSTAALRCEFYISLPASFGAQPPPHSFARISRNLGAFFPSIPASHDQRVSLTLFQQAQVLRKDMQPTGRGIKKHQRACLLPTSDRIHPLQGNRDLRILFRSLIRQPTLRCSPLFSNATRGLSSGTSISAGRTALRLGRSFRVARTEALIPLPRSQEGTFLVRCLRTRRFLTNCWGKSVRRSANQPGWPHLFTIVWFSSTSPGAASSCPSCIGRGFPTTRKQSTPATATAC